MLVQKFDTEKGVYVFELVDFETDFHSHPALEVIYAIDGNFSVSTSNTTENNLTFAIISSNVLHSVSALNCRLKLSMLEHRDALIFTALRQLDIHLLSGVYFYAGKNHHLQAHDKLIQSLLNVNSLYDSRVKSAINFIDNTNVQYAFMLKSLLNLTHLSESRLSHLFKEHVGVSIKKYLVWSRLKSTIKLHIQQKEDLFTSLFKSGFYDQPHFCRAFKKMLGINPSKVYNSRTVQGYMKIYR